MIEEKHNSRRVLHIISGDVWGGKEAQMLLQLAALEKFGWQIEVLFFSPGLTQNRYQEAGLKCHIISEQQGLRTLLREATTFWRESPPKIVVSHGYKEALVGFFLAKQLHAFFIQTFHGYSHARNVGKRFKLSYYNFLHRCLARYFADRIITVSAALGKDLGFHGQQKHVVIRNAVELNSKSQNVAPPALSLEHPAIIVVGRLVGIKKIDLAIAAVAEIHRSSSLRPHLYILGEGEEEQQLKSLDDTRQLQGYIHFLGFRADAQQIIAHAQLLLITSQFEGIPTVMLEALAHSIPVVASNLPGIAEVQSLLPPAPISLVSSQTKEGFSLALSAVLAAVLAAALTGSAYASYNEQTLRDAITKCFAPERAAEDHHQLYDSLLNSPRNHK